MGEMSVPANAYYGAQTARAVENFPISNWRFPRAFIRALGLIKTHAANTNAELGLLDPKIANAIQKAGREVIDGKFDDQFVVDVFQTGSGTSTNMNANEVMANRASEILGGKAGDRSVHPNDHVNKGQSSNDVIPSAIHLSALDGIVHRLVPALEELEAALRLKADEFREIIKIGRTHLQDATPIRLGQEFSGYAAQIEQGIARLESVVEHLGALALGGTAVGTGINTHVDFAPRTIAKIAVETGLILHEAENHFAAQAAIDGCVEASGALKSVAVALVKIANDIRWLGSGPRCGLGELRLPATQPGSSIMPGKVNPVMLEMTNMVCYQVIGFDTTIAFAAQAGQLELNVMMPIIAHDLTRALSILATTLKALREKCIDGITANEEVCRKFFEASPSIATALNPYIGYMAAAEIAKESVKTKKTVVELVREKKLLTEEQIAKVFSPENMTHPGGS
jgi:fumarate hydratase class II